VSLWSRYEGTAERLVQRLVNQLTNPDADRPPEIRKRLAKAVGHALPEVRAPAEYCQRRLALVLRSYRLTWTSSKSSTMLEAV